ncbi:MAG: MBOAT family protein, partial [Lachnospiraceae bacterium]|nr:MBOAT family protein [Lachnospiraceae bacterium]
MVFTSYAFLGFLALVFLGYYVIPKKWQGMFLLLASLIFYAFSGITNLAYILAVTLITYFGALQIGKVHETQKAYLKANKETLDKDAKKKYREEKTKLR